jgi:hypothetical protein
MLLSNISYHTHSLQIRGHPQLLARLLSQTVSNEMEGGALPRPSNPDNIAAGGRDRRTMWGGGGGGGGGKGGEEGWLIADNSF